MSIEGKVTLVTGGSHGIGRGISYALAREGARIVVNYLRDQEAADQTVAKIEGMGGEATAVRVDVGEIGECKALIEKANEAFGPVDILVSNAGMGQRNQDRRYSRRGVGTGD